MPTPQINTTDRRSKRRPGIDRQRSIITEAAVALFAQRGIRGVSIAQICAQADVSRPTFYRCFGDKETLVEMIYAEAVDAHIDVVLLQGKLHEPHALNTRIDSMLDAIFARQQLAQLLFVEASDPTSPAAQIIDRQFERAATVLTRALRAANGSSPSKVYLKSVMAAFQWLVHDAIRKGLSTRARREAKEAAHALALNALSQSAGP